MYRKTCLKPWDDDKKYLINYILDLELKLYLVCKERESTSRHLHLKRIRSYGVENSCGLWLVHIVFAKNPAILFKHRKPICHGEESLI